MMFVLVVLMALRCIRSIVLKLSLPSVAHVANIRKDAQPLDFYNDPEIQKGMSVHPFLTFDIDTGKITGHEGRHRAAAVINAGGKVFQVALFPRPGHREHVLENLPTTLTAEFSTFEYELDYDLMTEWKMGNFKGHQVV